MFSKKRFTFWIVAELATALGGYAQTMRKLSTAAADPLTTPVVQTVALATGAYIQTAGTGLGLLNLGHVSWAQDPHMFGSTHKKDRNLFSISTVVGLRVDCSAADAGRFVAISAFLQQVDPRYDFYFDGVRLSSASSVVSPSAACGTTAAHALEVQVPTTSAAGAINPSVGFKVTLR
jgi:hypothetical protein